MNYPKRITLLILLILALGLGWVFRDTLKEYLIDFKNDIGFFGDPAFEMMERDLKTIVSTPPPLRFDSGSHSAHLTVQGSIEETNRQRETNGLPPLKQSEGLRKMAELKLDDMFARQYFEHESPTGEGPADLARQAGYSFVTVGENLALGNFTDDEELLQGWMNSPGHRANILSERYTEIGIAVRKGTFEGKTTWLAVQEFGTPSSVCPGPDTSLENSLEANRAELERQEPVIDQKKRELDAHEPKRGPEYEAKVREYNNLVERYNALVQTTKDQVETYNSQVAAYNDCLSTYSDG